MHFLDGLKDGREESIKVRAALVASGHYKAKEVFSDWFDKPPEDGDPTGGDDVEYDYQEVVWETPGTSGIDEFERVQEMLKMTGISLDESEGPIQETPAFFASDDDESAEWV